MKRNVSFHYMGSDTKTADRVFDLDKIAKELATPGGAIGSRRDENSAKGLAINPDHIRGMTVEAPATTGPKQLISYFKRLLS